MKLDVICTVNAGLYLWNGKTGLFVDAMHKGKNLGFSDTPEEIVRQMVNHEGLFERKNDFLFTHIHEDHFDQKLMTRCLQEYPDSIVFGPVGETSNIEFRFVEKNVFALSIRDYHIWVFKTIHDGKNYKGCECTRILLKWENLVC